MQAERVVNNRAYVIQRLVHMGERCLSDRRILERYFEAIEHYETFGYVKRRLCSLWKKKIFVSRSMVNPK